jgi:hypothetical protein
METLFVIVAAGNKPAQVLIQDNISYRYLKEYNRNNLRTGSLFWPGRNSPTGKRFQKGLDILFFWLFFLDNNINFQ